MTRPLAVVLGALVLSSWPSSGAALVITLDPEELGTPASAPSGSPATPSVPSGSPGPDAPSATGDLIRVEASPSKAEVALGERFVVEVKATAPAGTSFSFPAEVVTEGAELRALPPEGAAAGGSPPPARPGVQRYEAALFELTDAKVPTVVVRYRGADGTSGEAATEPVAVKIVSRLAKDADPLKIADIRGPVSLTVGRAFWIAIGLILAAILAVVIWRVRRRRRPAESTITASPPKDPAAEAREALAALAASGLLARGDHRGFYIALTAIAKRYLERRLAAPVLEMTTSEMVAFLRDSPKGQSLVTPMRDLASAADQIKFARGAGLQAEAERHTEAVLSMIRSLEAALAPPAPPAEQEKVA
ncbi:MAG TPA: hypothetical protein VI669_02940 [Vicinamibacteria bacterium]